MMNILPTSVDINLATHEELESVPGIGPKLAGRIRIARPFESIDDLQRVSGIGATLLDQLRPYLRFTLQDRPVFEKLALLPVTEISEVETLDPTKAESVETAHEPVVKSNLPEITMVIEETSTQPQPEQVSETAADLEPKGEPLPDPFKDEQPTLPAPEKRAMDQPAVQTAPREGSPPPAKPAEKKPITRGEVIWIGAALAILVLVLSFIFNLGVLTLLNGTLNFASASTVRTLLADSETLATRVQVLEGDIEILQNRLNTIEGFGGRITTLERNHENLRGDLNATNQEMDRLVENIELFSGQIEELQEHTLVFQNFLDGLRDLLNPTETP